MLNECSWLLTLNYYPDGLQLWNTNKLGVNKWPLIFVFFRICGHKLKYKKLHLKLRKNSSHCGWQSTGRVVSPSLETFQTPGWMCPWVTSSSHCDPALAGLLGWVISGMIQPCYPVVLGARSHWWKHIRTEGLPADWPLDPKASSLSSVPRRGIFIAVSSADWTVEIKVPEFWSSSALCLVPSGSSWTLHTPEAWNPGSLSSTFCEGFFFTSIEIPCLSLPESALSYLLMSLIIIFIYNLGFLKTCSFYGFFCFVFSPLGTLWVWQFFLRVCFSGSLGRVVIEQREKFVV